MRMITECEVCDGTELISFLDLGAQPMCDDLVPIGSPQRPAAYPLRLGACPRCLTVHQEVQVEKQLLFPPTYHYRAAMTQDVLDGMAELVATVEGLVGGLPGKQVLDIGCNDGSLLAIFKSKGARTFGIEPTGAAEDAKMRVDQVLNQFFDAEAVEAYLAGNPKPDVITFTNVFAHIEDLQGVIANLKRLMKPDTKLVIENHYLGAVIERNQFDTFYHEHPRTYSYRSFEHIAGKLGRSITHVEFPPRYNGNIRIVISEGEAAPRASVNEEGYLEALRAMPELVDKARAEIRGRLQALAAQHGPLPGKAFPGRAAILTNAFGLDADIIDATYERSASPKIGHYVPGSSIEIRDEAEFFASRLQAPVLVNFAWHIHGEIERYMRGKGYAGEIVPLFQ
ncbi:MAG TPA: class I SAM-dependent methyltransferase [Caulobacteraceae bacterium]|nr:class I SAM-dependent methyltransferase [Caulobacteraceae bacterium]